MAKRPPAEPPSKQQQIDDEIRRQIIDGTFAAGQRLPTWDQLEERFGVSRLTIRRGLAALHADGFLAAARSRGTRVVDHPPHQFHYALALPFWLSSANPVPSFWAGLLKQAQQTQDAGPQRFTHYFGFDWGYTGESLTKLALDASAHRIAGIVAVSHARFPVINHSGIRAAKTPVVAVTSVINDPRVPTVGPDLAAFRQRAVALLQATGKTRIACVGDFASPHDESLTQLVATIENASLETRPIWRASVPWNRADWAHNWVETVFRLPPKDRPEALLILDEHLAAPAAAALAQVAAETQSPPIPIISQTNFPAPSPAPPHVTRVGFDLHATLTRALDTLDALRQGRKSPLLALMPPLLESELLPKPTAPGPVDLSNSSPRQPGRRI